MTALFGLGGAFHLLADRHAKAFADQRQQIAFGSMDRHATHGDVLALMLAAFGQRDVQRFGSGHGIVEKHLVKIAHAVEQQRICVVRFKLKILRHHWRYFFCLHGGPLLQRGPYKTPRSRERGCRRDGRPLSGNFALTRRLRCVGVRSWLRRFQSKGRAIS